MGNGKALVRLLFGKQHDAVTGGIKYLREHGRDALHSAVVIAVVEHTDRFDFALSDLQRVDIAELLYQAISCDDLASEARVTQHRKDEIFRPFFKDYSARLVDPVLGDLGDQRVRDVV